MSKGRPRRIFKPQVEWTPEIEKVAMKIMWVAADRVLRNLGLLRRNFITHDDLISNCWLRTFFYLKKPEHVKTKLFIWAQIEMCRYIRQEFPQFTGPSLETTILGSDPEGRDDFSELVPESDRVWDDPKRIATEHETLEAIAQAARELDPRSRRIFEMRYFDGLTLLAIAKKVKLTRERVRQLYKAAAEQVGVQYTDRRQRRGRK